MERDWYLQTSDPDRLIRVWWDDWLDEPEIELVAGEVDPFSAFANTLRRPVMKRARAEARAHGLRLREPHRMFLRLWR